MAQPPPGPGPGVPPSAPPAYPPPSSTYPPYPPPKKDYALILVVVIAIAVAIVLIAAAVYFFVLAPLRVITTRPSATFTNVQVANGVASFSVLTISAEWSPLFFLVNLQVNGASGMPESLFTAVSIVIGTDTYAVGYTDADADNGVSVGDRFQVSRAGGLPPSSSFTFSLLWTDQAVVGTAQWTTSPTVRPLITFGGTTFASGNVSLSVAAASELYDRTFYLLALSVNGTTSSPVAINAEPSWSTFTVSSASYRVYWTDLADDRFVNGGDSFLITGDSVPLGSGDYILHVLWKADGAEIVFRAFAIP